MTLFIQEEPSIQEIWESDLHYFSEGPAVVCRKCGMSWRQSENYDCIPLPYPGRIPDEPYYPDTEDEIMPGKGCRPGSCGNRSPVALPQLPDCVVSDPSILSSSAHSGHNSRRGTRLQIFSLRPGIRPTSKGLHLLKRRSLSLPQGSMKYPVKQLCATKSYQVGNVYTVGGNTTW